MSTILIYSLFYFPSVYLKYIVYLHNFQFLGFCPSSPHSYASDLRLIPLCWKYSHTKDSGVLYYSIKIW